MTRGAAFIAIAVVVVLLGPLGAARGDDVDGLLRTAEKAVAAQKFDDAIAALRQAREAAPQNAKVALRLARAFEAGGYAEDAIAYYVETVRLDADGLGGEAKTAAARLRAQWVAVEMSTGEEHAALGAFEEARKAYERAFDVAGDDLKAERVKAREAYARTIGLELVKEALKGREAKQQVVAIAEVVGEHGPLADMAEAVEAELVRAFKDGEATVVGASKISDASLVVKTRAGQRFLIRVEDVSQGGVVASQLAVRALMTDSEPVGMPPEPIALSVAVEAERLAGGRSERVAVAEGSTLASGDRFRMRARIDCTAHLYVFMFDSQGRATLLYPGTERLFPDLAKAGITTGNPVGANTDVLIPPPSPSGQQAWFYLDDHVGTEAFYVAASLVPLRDVEGLVREIGQSGARGAEASRKLAQALESRAGATRVEGANAETVRGRGAVIRFFSFEHGSR